MIQVSHDGSSLQLRPALLLPDVQAHATGEMHRVDLRHVNVATRLTAKRDTTPAARRDRTSSRSSGTKQIVPEQRLISWWNNFIYRPPHQTAPAR